MSKRIQSRRSVSIKGTTYQRLRQYCQERDVSMSGLVEALVLAKLDAREDLPKDEEVAQTAKRFQTWTTRPPRPKPEPKTDDGSDFFPGGVHNF